MMQCCIIQNIGYLTFYSSEYVLLLDTSMISFCLCFQTYQDFCFITRSFSLSLKGTVSSLQN